MRAQTLNRTALVAFALLAADGCSTLRPRAKLEVQPTQMASGGLLNRDDAAYASAVGAIDRRDYAEALEQLQAADRLRPGQARVNNALGVVYDKLGRFDLSARYYARAAAADPGSTIIASNLAYSRVLERRADLASAAPEMTFQVASVAPGPAPTIEQPIIRIRLTPPPAAVVALQGPNHGVWITDASGRPSAGATVRLALVHRGWSLPPVVGARTASQANSVIAYPAGKVQIARALARTLGYPVRLEPCAAACAAVHVVLGRDVRLAAAPPVHQTRRAG